MKKTSVTPQVLEMLLDNWGVFATTGRWGPKEQTECGSVERAYNSNLERYVWEGDAQVVPKQADDALGALLDRIIAAMPIDHVRPLAFYYGYRRQPFEFAGTMRITRAQADALLVSAKATVKQKLEAMGYEQSAYINR